MEKIKNERDCTIESLFQQVGVGNYLHVSKEAYDSTSISTESSRQNRYARLTGELNGRMDVKYRVKTTIKEGYTTIFQLK